MRLTARETKALSQPGTNETNLAVTPLPPVLINQGMRRFYLGAVVDDLFLATNCFEYDGGANEAQPADRCSGEDLANLLLVQQALNAEYPGSDIITEFAMNGAGIADKVKTEQHTVQQLYWNMGRLVFFRPT